MEYPGTFLNQQDKGVKSLEIFTRFIWFFKTDNCKDFIEALLYCFKFSFKSWFLRIGRNPLHVFQSTVIKSKS